MKLFVIFFAGLISISVHAQSLSPEIVPVSYKNIYVPSGFDSNDSVQFAADGVFANACYKIAAPDVVVDELNMKIKVEAQAYFYSGMCATVLIPFQQVVQVGIVKTPGTYSIIDGTGAEMGRIEIKPATSALEDDYLYAPVQKVAVDSEGGSQKLTLKIEFNDNCMKLKEVRVEKQANVIVILPIAEMTAAPLNCAQGYFKWTEVVDLGPLESKRYLIHVRTTGSQAINEILAN